MVRDFEFRGVVPGLNSMYTTCMCTRMITEKMCTTNLERRYVYKISNANGVPHVMKAMNKNLETFKSQQEAVEMDQALAASIIQCCIRVRSAKKELSKRKESHQLELALTGVDALALKPRRFTMKVLQKTCIELLRCTTRQSNLYHLVTDLQINNSSSSSQYTDT